MFLPQLVAKNAEEHPSRPFFVYCNPENDHVVTITQLEFGRATHRAATVLRKGPDAQVVAILAQSDTILYHALLVGLMTANLVPFPISPRNSAAGIFQLLRASSCHRILATCVTLAPLVAAIKEHVSQVDPDYILDIEEVPLLAQIYPNVGFETPASPFQPYPFDASRSSPDDVELYMHSSGSTGFPRAIAQTHRVLKQWCSLPAVAEAAQNVAAPIGNMALPSFHLFGICCQLLHPLHGLYAAVYPPTATSTNALPMIPSPDNILQHTRATKCRSLTTVPALLAAWFHSPDSVSFLGTLHSVIWAGGPLPQRIGDALVQQGVKLRSVYGATEIGTVTDLRLNDGDEKEWAWFKVSDKVDVRWVPQGEDIFEMQILSSDTHGPTIENLDDTKGYGTSDLCTRHPQKPYLWRIVGRVDDTIVHSSGEKTVPGPMENIITSTPLVAEAVMFGRERPQAGILIEVRSSFQIDVDDQIQLAELRNKVWSCIEEANAIAPAFSRIFKEMILFTSRDKPLPRSGKGSVMRKAALSLYAAEIDALYNVVEQSGGGVDSIEPPAKWEFGLVHEWLLTLATNICNTVNISPFVDLRQQGFDSLTATVFRLHVVRALRLADGPAFVKAVDAISQNLVYDYPTILDLTTYIVGLVDGKTPKSKMVNGKSTLGVLAATISDETIVEVCSGGGIPLVAFPGSTGRINNLLALRSHFSGTLWACQVTTSTPTDSFVDQVEFFAHKIREKRPNGPYRISSYSGSSILAVAVTKLLEDAGQEVIQLTFMEHFPMIWALEETEQSLRGDSLSDAVDGTIGSVIELFRHDPAFGPDSEQVRQWTWALAGSPQASAIHQDAAEQLRRVSMPLTEFLRGFYPPENRTCGGFADSLAGWVSSVKAPFSLVSAESGVVATLPATARERWSDLGAHLCGKPVTHRVLRGLGHFGMLADKRTAAFLQEQINL